MICVIINLFNKLLATLNSSHFFVTIKIQWHNDSSQDKVLNIKEYYKILKITADQRKAITLLGSQECNNGYADLWI